MKFNNYRSLQQERQANRFAMCLLMPDAMVFKEIDDYVQHVGTPQQDLMIKHLSNRFKVSTVAMTSRLYDLGIINSL